MRKSEKSISSHHAPLMDSGLTVITVLQLAQQELLPVQQPGHLEFAYSASESRSALPDAAH